MSGSKQEGPADFWSEVLNSKPFRERIGYLKYARWAQGLTEKQFEVLLCAIGEYGYRARKPLEVLRQHAPKDDPVIARAIMGLEILAEFAAGYPITLEEQRRRLDKVIANYQTTKAEPDAAPNGGPGIPSGSSGGGSGPPSVS